ncbi:MAG: cytochrome c biogenesis protein CcdA [Ideonella sp.]|nr:cytochrome c biogenesis protein CcdA [Ideonella sp.]
MVTEGLLAALLAGVVTSASPCALAAVPVAVGFVGGQARSPQRAWGLSLAFVAGMNLALLTMGLAVARLGGLLGALPGPWLVAVGGLVVLLAVTLWRTNVGACGMALPLAWQSLLARSGTWGALVLGALMGTVMSPCATPALAAALTMAGSGALLGGAMWWGAALLLAYGLGRSILLLLAGAMPTLASSMVRHLTPWSAWLPGQRLFALLLALAGLYWIALGLQWV